MQQICNTRSARFSVRQVIEVQANLPLEDDPVAVVLGPLTAHNDVLRYLAEIHLERVRHLQPLSTSLRADALPRARRRVLELPSLNQLDNWYVILKRALEDRPNDGLSRHLILLMMGAQRGKPVDDVVIAAFVSATRDARLSPNIVAGAVGRSFTAFRAKPSAQAFFRLCAAHRAEVQYALDHVTRTMGLRRDAEKVAARV